MCPKGHRDKLLFVSPLRLVTTVFHVSRPSPRNGAGTGGRALGERPHQAEACSLSLERRIRTRSRRRLCTVRGSTADHVHRVIGHCCALEAPLGVSNDPSAAPWCAAPAGVAWRGPRPEPRPGLPAKPSTPCVRNRCTHLYTKRRLMPTVAAMSVIVTPSARSNKIRPRRASPAWMVVERCHANSVCR
jgi:hypothetical protein